MCENCDYHNILENAGLEATDNRLSVMEVIGGNNYPLTASEVYQTIDRTGKINKVTVYRILDLLVEKRVLERIRMGGRAAHYGLAPNENHARHPHFYCTECATIDCLPPDSLTTDMEQLHKTFPGRIDRIEVQVEGVCRSCLRKRGE